MDGEPLRSLDQIGHHHGSDKFTRHQFGSIYERFLAPFRHEPIRLLEIGVGEEDRALGGSSLLTWAEYFTRAQIVGIDLYDKSRLDSDRISTRICDQSSASDLLKLSVDLGPFDVIIDDGSHAGQDTNLALFSLFPLLADGGLYVIEDIQTSYWPPYGGSSVAPMAHDTAVRWLKFAIDIVNRSENLLPDQFPLTADLALESIHVFHNIAFLQKSSGTTAGSAILDADIRSAYLAIDLAENGGRHEVHLEMISRPDLFANLLDAVASVGGIEEAVHRLHGMRPES